MATMNVTGVSQDLLIGSPDPLALVWSGFNNPDSVTFSATQVTVTEYTGYNSTFVWEVSGSFIQAADGSISGTVTALKLSDLGPTGAGTKVQLMNLTGLNSSYVQLSEIERGWVNPYVLLDGNDTLTATGFVARPLDPWWGIDMSGGAGNDNLTGTNYNDILNGDTGNDIMAGLKGNDTYRVDSSLDVVTELAGQGRDLVKSTISYTLGANLEDLKLTSISHINGTGNALDNDIIGGAGNNILSGGAGMDSLFGNAGNDTLIAGIGDDTLNGGKGNDSLNSGAGNDLQMGGLGKDSFVFNSALNETTNIDFIVDFAAIDDTIKLENAVFTSLTATGVLNATMLRSGAGFSTAADNNDFIIYDQTTGALYYDADANGAGAAVQFATLVPGAAVTNADFVVI